MKVKNIANELGGKKTLGKSINNRDQFIALINEGFPFLSLDHFSSRINMPLGDLAVVLMINQRTLARRKKTGQLLPVESDRLARLAKILAYAIEVLGTQKKASRWLQKSNHALKMRPPIQLLDTDIGSVEVENLLGRIDHGIYS